MKKKLLIILIATFSFQLLHAQLARDPKDEKFMDELEVKLKRREKYIEILKVKGPEAYFKARGLTLSDEDKELFTKDLMKIIENKNVIRVYVDREARLMVVEEGSRRSTYDIRLLRKGLVETSSGQRILYANMPYSEQREIAVLKSKSR